MEGWTHHDGVLVVAVLAKEAVDLAHAEDAVMVRVDSVEQLHQALTSSLIVPPQARIHLPCKVGGGR